MFSEHVREPSVGTAGPSSSNLETHDSLDLERVRVHVPRYCPIGTDDPSSPVSPPSPKPLGTGSGSSVDVSKEER